MPVQLTYYLHVRWGNRIVLRALRQFQKLFRAEFGFQTAVWMHSARLDALFRFKNLQVQLDIPVSEYRQFSP